MRAMRYAAAAMLASTVTLAGAARADTPSARGSWGQALAASTPIAGALALAEGLNLRFDVSLPQRSVLGDSIDRPLHRRLLSAMVDYFPLGGNSGFHVSGGTLRGPKTRMGVEAEWLNPSKLVTTKVAGNSTFRGNTRRSAPALTMGYSVSPLRNLDLGLEVGEAFGRINSMSPSAGVRRLGDMATNRIGGGGGGLNPVVHLGLGMRF